MSVCQFGHSAVQFNVYAMYVCIPFILCIWNHFSNSYFSLPKQFRFRQNTLEFPSNYIFYTFHILTFIYHYQNEAVMIFITWLELTKYIILTLQRSQFICDAHRSKTYKDIKTQMAPYYVLYLCICSKNTTYTYWCFYNTNCILVCWDTCLFGANTLLMSPILSY